LVSGGTPISIRIAFLLRRVAEKDDITMPELAGELEAACGMRADPASVSRGLFATAIALEKRFWPASECDRPDIRQAREEWRTERQPGMRLKPQRLVFLDETGTTTKMTRLRGCCLKGWRLRSKAPFGHWKTQTFVAGLRCGTLTASFVIDAPTDGRIVETHVETQLVPILEKDDIVIIDNLPAHGHNLPTCSNPKSATTTSRPKNTDSREHPALRDARVPFKLDAAKAARSTRRVLRASAPRARPHGALL
jgi:DDE superfamily endonuclease